MKKLHTFMLKSFIGPFFATFFISMFVLIMQFLWRMIDDIVGKGLEASVLLELFTYMSATLVPMALPLAVLLSSIMTFGALGENYELIALKSAGISLYKIMRPLIVVIVALTLLAFFFANNILPVANLKLYTLLYDIRKAKPEMVFKDGIFTNDLEGYSIKINRINKETGMMYDLLIYTHKNVNGNYEVTRADSGMMNTIPNTSVMQLVLFSGQTYTDESVQDPRKKKTFPFRRVSFESQIAHIDIPDSDLKRSDDDVLSSHYRMLNLNQLDHASDSIGNVLDTRKGKELNRLLALNYFQKRNLDQNKDSVLFATSKDRVLSSDSLYLSCDLKNQKRVLEGALGNAREIQQQKNGDKLYYLSQEESIRKHKIEWHKKFTMALACFIFFFIGAPLGAIIRKGGLGMPLVVCVFLFIMYYVISMIGERSATENVLLPWIGTWGSSFITLVLGVFLTYKSVTDSEMLNAESYHKMYIRLKYVLQKGGRFIRTKLGWKGN